MYSLSHIGTFVRMRQDHIISLEHGTMPLHKLFEDNRLPMQLLGQNEVKDRELIP